jgi:succinate dehydrogenase / fumarate reductase membrane anchor subunit
MVTSATNFSRSGLRDWIIQRISAVVLALYLFTILIFFAANSGLDFQSWRNFFYNPFMQIFSFLALLSLAAHAWIGVWTIFTDYVKSKGLRLFLEAVMALALLAYVAWGFSIIWP